MTRSNSLAMLLSAWALALSLLVVASPARAQDMPPQALLMFQEGKAHMDKGAWQQACESFRKSEAIYPSVGAELNLGLCHENLGRLATAWTWYRTAEVLADRNGDHERERGARELADKLVPRLGLVTVAVSEPIAKLDVKIDGATVVPGVPTAFDPGAHVLSATAEGYEPWSKSLDIKPGSKSEELVPALAPSGEGDGAGGETPGAPGRTQAIVGWTLAGVGGAALIVGAVAGGVAFDRRNQLEEECNGTPGGGLDEQDKVRCNFVEGGTMEQNMAEIEKRIDDEIRPIATVSTVMFIAGGALVAGGVVVVLTAPSGDEPASEAALAPLVLPGGAGLQVGGTF